jgi:uncharacterized protein YgiM (DUF1202 family)
MKSKILMAFLAILLSLIPFDGLAETGTVKGNNVNVRGQATVQSEVVTQFKKGENVTIVDKVPASRRGPKEPASFYRIALPSGTPVWVSANFVKDGVVSATRLNVRSGPGQKFSVLGRIAKGTQINELRRVDEWLEIATAPGVHGFVASFLIDAEGFGSTPSTTAGLASVEPPSVPIHDLPETPLPTAPTTINVPEPEPIFVPDIEPVAPAPIAPGAPVAPISQLQFSTISTPTTAPYYAPPTGADTVSTTVGDSGSPTIAPDPSLVLSEEAARPAEEEVQIRVETEPQQRSTVLGRWWQRVTSKRKKQPEPAVQAAEDRFQEATPLPDEGPVTPRVITREGIVVRSLNIQAPTDYGLKEIYTGKLINYLWAADDAIPWKKLTGRTVVVTGEEAIDRRWRSIPVLKIDKLKTIDNDGEG